ncbi:hypothetical protein [Paenibacillus flagellatus]|uniref:Uncharacterized protein n=1 Tax=Paenibacillus flagellatus TaxID=2211139 RepID=A0A2V5K9X8_9BACL|nr:hypothetical protein [Paenibacillus flagellatus]PYI56375.1 hypothetical protein DLM86_05185 [Paenibacillus flagellatus]
MSVRAYKAVWLSFGLLFLIEVVGMVRAISLLRDEYNGVMSAGGLLGLASIGAIFSFHIARRTANRVKPAVIGLYAVLLLVVPASAWAFFPAYSHEEAKRLVRQEIEDSAAIDESETGNVTMKTGNPFVRAGYKIVVNGEDGRAAYIVNPASGKVSLVRDEG